jgi:hypothetical protein
MFSHGAVVSLKPDEVDTRPMGKRSGRSGWTDTAKDIVINSFVFRFSDNAQINFRARKNQG